MDVRIIASTNESLAAMVEKNRFRKDLFYRLNVASYSIMPLRERPGDIPLVCDHYIKIYNARLNHMIEGIDSETSEFMSLYPWEGNVRELKNVIEYVCTIKSKGMITLHDLPRYMFGKRGSGIVSPDKAALRRQDSSPASNAYQEIANPASAPYILPGQSLEAQLEVPEKEIVSQAIRRNRYNISKTANELKISRQTLYNKLKKYELL